MVSIKQKEHHTSSDVIIPVCPWRTAIGAVVFKFQTRIV